MQNKLGICIVFSDGIMKVSTLIEGIKKKY